MIGRVPSVQELREFLASKEADKKAKLVAKLLYDEAYQEEYARNWTTIWTNILIGRNGGMEDRSLISREGMQKYLRDSFARNKPYDRMVYELVTATGGTAPGSKDFNGAANFLVMKLDENAAQATAYCGRSTRVDTMVAIEFAASCKPLRKSNTSATAISAISTGSESATMSVIGRLRQAWSITTPWMRLATSSKRSTTFSR